MRVAAFATRIGLLGSAWFQFQSGLWMRLNARDLIQQTILLEGMWDPCLTAFIESHLMPGDVFVDVGGHAGYFTLLASRRVSRTGKVLVIEPNPWAVRELSENVRRNRLENVLVEHTACGASQGVVVLHLHTAANSSMASLSTSNATGGRSIEVPCITLDELFEKRGLNRATLVKIDVEGAELVVLRGMKRVLERMRPVVVLELEPRLLEGCGTTVEAVVALLAEFDYDISPLGGHCNYVCRPAVRSLGAGSRR